MVFTLYKWNQSSLFGWRIWIFIGPKSHLPRSFCLWYCVKCHQMHFVILSIKQIGSEKLDFFLFGENIYYPETFCTRVLQFKHKHCKHFPPWRQSFTKEHFLWITSAFHFPIQLGLFPRRVNHPPQAPGGRGGTPAVSTWWGSPFPYKPFSEFLILSISKGIKPNSQTFCYCV